MDLDDVLVEADTPHYTELRPTLRGSFNLSAAEIPYFQSILSLEDASKELGLVENLPAELRSRWRLEELFQREIDWERVQHELVNGYLRRPEKLKFFNALTVALLPIDERRMLAAEYGVTPREPELRDSLRREPWQTINIGGVQVVSNQKAANGYIRWDPRRIFAATIDGQHRLAALQTLYSQGNLTFNMLQTGIPVIYLVLDLRAGFLVTQQQRADDENPILTVVREVFIDLNKHAKEVKRARRILLDDQEIESRCLRQLLAERMGDRPPGRLPLALVHWQHNESAKFNTGEKTGPFITTVELLHAIVQELLDLKHPKDPMDESQVRRFVASIEGALSVSKVIEENPAKYPNMTALGPYVERMHLRDGMEVPLANLNAQYVRVCEDAFVALWRPLIVSVLLRFAPYERFIREVEARGGTEGDLAFWLVLPRKAQRQKADEWGEARIEKIDKPLKELAGMKSTEWAFFAVFQKALLRATVNAWRHYDVTADRTTIDEFLEKWINFLNDMWGRGHFAVKGEMETTVGGKRIWLGIALNVVSQSVRYSESSVERISGTILVWWHFYTEKLKKPKPFIKKLEARDSSEKYAGLGTIVGKLKACLEPVVSPENPDDDTAKQAEARFYDIVALATNAAESSVDSVEGESDS
jgi:hypothetical protein